MLCTGFPDGPTARSINRRSMLNPTTVDAICIVHIMRLPCPALNAMILLPPHLPIDTLRRSWWFRLRQRRYTRRDHNILLLALIHHDRILGYRPCIGHHDPLVQPVLTPTHR